MLMSRDRPRAEHRCQRVSNCLAGHRERQFLSRIRRANAWICTAARLELETLNDAILNRANAVRN